MEISIPITLVNRSKKSEEVSTAVYKCIFALMMFYSDYQLLEDSQELKSTGSARSCGQGNFGSLQPRPRRGEAWESPSSDLLPSAAKQQKVEGQSHAFHHLEQVDKARCKSALKMINVGGPSLLRSFDIFDCMSV